MPLKELNSTISRTTAWKRKSGISKVNKLKTLLL